MVKVTEVVRSVRSAAGSIRRLGRRDRPWVSAHERGDRHPASHPARAAADLGALGGT